MRPASLLGIHPPRSNGPCGTCSKFRNQYIQQAPALPAATGWASGVYPPPSRCAMPLVLLATVPDV